MLEGLFRGLFDSEYTAVIGVGEFLACVGVSLVLGLLIAGACAFRNRCTASFLTTVALLPAVVCVVIMMVNGNVGTGVAVAGAFSLVRFRSIPGTAREIGVLFLAMAAGLITGMGYLAYGVLFTVVLCGVFMVYTALAGKKKPDNRRILRITIPEDLDYTGVFEDIFQEYTKGYELTSVKTANLGSLYRLTYEVELRRDNVEKPMLDSLRCRNGNLEITVSRQETTCPEL